MLAVLKKVADNSQISSLHFSRLAPAETARPRFVVCSSRQPSRVPISVFNGMSSDLSQRLFCRRDCNPIPGYVPQQIGLRAATGIPVERLGVPTYVSRPAGHFVSATRTVLVVAAQYA